MKDENGNDNLREHVEPEYEVTKGRSPQRNEVEEDQEIEVLDIRMGAFAKEYMQMIIESKSSKAGDIISQLRIGVVDKFQLSGKEQKPYIRHGICIATCFKDSSVLFAAEVDKSEIGIFGSPGVEVSFKDLEKVKDLNLSRPLLGFLVSPNGEVELVIVGQYEIKTGKDDFQTYELLGRVENLTTGIPTIKSTIATYSQKLKSIIKENPGLMINFEGYHYLSDLERNLGIPIKMT